MNTIIETKRLVLRELELSDSEHFFALNANLEVLKYTGDRPFLSISEAESFLRNYDDYKKNGFGRWAVIHRESGAFLGWCGLKLNEENRVDLGFRFFEKFWGKGYATESASAALEVGFTILNLSEIIGRAAVDNQASIRVLEKIGMHFWRQGSCDGIENAVYFKIKRSEYNLMN